MIEVIINLELVRTVVNLSEGSPYWETVLWKLWGPLVPSKHSFLSITRAPQSEYQSPQSVSLGTRSATVWKLRKFTLTLFWQKLRESNDFTNKITK